MDYLLRTINKLIEAQEQLTNAQVLSGEIDDDDREDIDQMIDCHINRLQKYRSRNHAKQVADEISEAIRGLR